MVGLKQSHKIDFLCEYYSHIYTSMITIKQFRTLVIVQYKTLNKFIWSKNWSKFIWQSNEFYGYHDQAI